MERNTVLVDDSSLQEKKNTPEPRFMMQLYQEGTPENTC